ncbi:MAG TPA: hypothetical protein VLS86_01760 [Acidimicrobiia bacterium]|nr:hypothetical protein [Acidimicrobiia bacterium]
MAPIPIHPGKGMRKSPDSAMFATKESPDEETPLTSAQRELLRRLALNDERALSDVIIGSNPLVSDLLDDKTRALVRLAGVITVGPEETSLRAAVDSARGSGARDEEILGTVISIAPMVGGTIISLALPLLFSAM